MSVRPRCIRALRQNPTMTEPDPFEHIRRQQEQLRKAMEGPLSSILREQTRLQKSLADPLDRVLKQQASWSRTLAPLAAQTSEFDRALRSALEGPYAQFARQQTQWQQALAQPLEQMRRNQEALARAFAAPYGTVLAAQEAFVRAAAVAADDAERDLTDPATFGNDLPWLAAFASAIREAKPTREQLELLVSHLSALVALIVMSIGFADGAGSLELLGAAATLFSALALLSAWLRE